VTVVSWQAEVSTVLQPATEIQAYERSIPNAGERLLALVECEVEHRHELERRIVRADNFRANLGLIAGILMPVGVSSASITAISRKAGRWDCRNWSDRSPDRHRLSRQESQLIKVHELGQEHRGMLNLQRPSKRNWPPSWACATACW